jgi:hypothetical protein
MILGGLARQGDPGCLANAAIARSSAHSYGVMRNGRSVPTFGVKGQSDATDPDHRDINYRVRPVGSRPTGACLSITWFKPRTRLPTIRFPFSV